MPVGLAHVLRLDQVDGQAPVLVGHVAPGPLDEQEADGARGLGLLHGLHGQVERRVALVVLLVQARLPGQQVVQRHLRLRVARPVQRRGPPEVLAVDVQAQRLEEELEVRRKVRGWGRRRPGRPRAAW